MGSCKEYELDDVMAICAIPVDDYDHWAVSALSPTIPAEDFTPPLGDAIAIGLQAAVSGGTFIPIVRKTGKAKDSPAVSVSGRRHTVTVECDVDDRDTASWTLLHQLQRGAYHLLLTFRGNTRGFVAGTADTFLCEVGRDGARTSVSLRVECLMGLQLIV